MLQPYEIDILGDLAGFAVLVIVFALLGGSKKLWARVWLYFCLLISGGGSATLLPEAISRGDMDVLAYHSFWTVLGGVGSYLLVVEYSREKARRSGADHTESSEEPKVYKITTLE